MSSKKSKSKKSEKPSTKTAEKETPKVEKTAEKKAEKKEEPAAEKKSLRSALLGYIEKTRAHKKSSLGTREKLIARFQKEFADREGKVVQDALVRYINDAKKNPLGKYLLTEDESGISITKAEKSSSKE